MISEDTITSGRGVLHDSHDLAIFKGKPNVIGAVLLHSDGALKRPKDDNINIEYSNMPPLSLLPLFITCHERQMSLFQPKLSWLIC